MCVDYLAINIEMVNGYAIAYKLKIIIFCVNVNLHHLLCHNYNETAWRK